MTNRYEIVISELESQSDDNLIEKLDEFMQEMDVDDTEEASIIGASFRPVATMKKLKKRTGPPKTSKEERKKAKLYRKKHKKEIEKKADKYYKKNRKEILKRAAKKR